MGKTIPLADRLARRLESQPNGCVYWIGAIGANGYGRIRVDGRTDYTHRVAYELAKGSIPAGYHVDHLCRNRACCNPDHLEAVTPRVNNLRIPGGKATREKCPEGHPYSGDNLRLWTDKRGYTRRYCRTCQLARSAAWNAGRRAA